MPYRLYRQQIFPIDCSNQAIKSVYLRYPKPFALHYIVSQAYRGKNVTLVT